MDNQALIAVIAKDRQSFRVWAKENLIDGPGVEFAYVDVDQIRKAQKRTRYDGIVLLPCAQDLHPHDVEDAIEYIKTTLFRADTSIQ